jgi:hypothetical protein
MEAEMIKIERYAVRGDDQIGGLSQGPSPSGPYLLVDDVHKVTAPLKDAIDNLMAITGLTSDDVMNQKECRVIDAARAFISALPLGVV